MTRNFLTVLYLIFGTLSVFGQGQVSVDFVLYQDEKKTQYRLVDLFNDVIKKKVGKYNCSEFRIVEDRKQATSQYVFELWEFGDYSKSNIFRETRYQKKTDSNNKEITTTYVAAGVQTSASTKLMGRLIDRVTFEVIDVFYINGDQRREIEDTDVKNKYNPSLGPNVKLENEKLAQYDNQLLEIRKGFYYGYVDKLEMAIHQCLRNILPPPIITKIHLEKEGKVKEVQIDECYEKEVNADWLYCDIMAEKEILDSKVFFKVGTSYPKSTKDKNNQNSISILGIRKGEKELYPLLQNKTKLIALEKPELEFYFEDKFKGEKKFIFYNIEYDIKSPYTVANKKYIELFLQSHFTTLKDVKTLAYLPEENSNIETIKTTVLNPNKYGDKLIKWDKSLNENNGSIVIKFEFNSNGTPIKDEITIYTLPGYMETNIVTNELEMVKIDQNIISNKASIKGITTIPDEKDEFILVQTDNLITRVNDILVYDTPEINKKTKPVGTLEKEMNLSPYLGVFKIDDGKKILQPGIKAKTNYYLVAEKKSTLFGLTASENITYFNYFNFK